VTQKENVRKTIYSKYFASSEPEYHFLYLLVEFGLNRGDIFNKPVHSIGN
jgi:hypothetical protein